MSEQIAPEAVVKIDVAQERNKPRLVSLLFFEYINATVEQKLNLLGIFDRLFVDPDVKRTVPIGVLVRTGQTFNGEVDVTIYDAEGGVAGGFAFDIREQSIPEGMNPFQAQFMGFLQFDAPNEGLYWFGVSYQGESLGGAGLKIEFRKIEGGRSVHARGDA